MRKLFISVLLTISLPLSALAMSSVEQKKRILIFSAMTSEQSEAFYELMAQSNPQVDGRFRPQSLDEADVVAYLLRSWSDVGKAPGADELPEVFNSVYEIESPTLNHSVFLDLTNGRSLQFIFYSLEDAGFPPIKCFAVHLAFEATREPGDEFENDILRDCIVGVE